MRNSFVKSLKSGFQHIDSFIHYSLLINIKTFFLISILHPRLSSGLILRYQASTILCSLVHSQWKQSFPVSTSLYPLKLTCAIHILDNKTQFYFLKNIKIFNWIITMEHLQTYQNFQPKHLKYARNRRSLKCCNLYDLVDIQKLGDLN